MSDPTHMEIRKLQVTGGSTYIISLPKDWVDNMGLRKGSSLELRRKDPGVICIQAEAREELNRSLEALIYPFDDETQASLIRRLVSCYLSGFRIIRIKTKTGRLDSTHRRALKRFTRQKLVGTEILKDVPDELTLQVLLSYKDLTVRNVLLRMSILVASMHKEAISILDSRDTAHARNVISMDDEVDRFNLYLIRLLKAACGDSFVLVESGLDSIDNCQSYRLITRAMERTGDHATTIAKNIIDLPQAGLDEVKEGIFEMSRVAIGIFEDAVESLFDMDYRAANDVLNLADGIEDHEERLINTIVQSVDSSLIPDMRLIVESIRRTAKYGANIAEVVLNLTLRDTIQVK